MHAEGALFPGYDDEEGGGVIMSMERHALAGRQSTPSTGSRKGSNNRSADNGGMAFMRRSGAT